MEKTKTRLEFFAIYDHTGISAHLHEQARQGWLLERIGQYGFWTYRKIQPKDMTFAVTYLPRLSAFDYLPHGRSFGFQAMCKQAGWKMAASNGKLQVYYSEEEDPVPLDTDPVVQVENIHETAERQVILPNVLVLLFGLFFDLFLLMVMMDGAVATPLKVLAGFCGAWLLVYPAAELLFYGRWHEKAAKAAEEGALLPTGSKRGFRMAAVGALALVLIWYGLTAGQDGILGHLVRVAALLTLAKAAVWTVNKVVKKLG